VLEAVFILLEFQSPSRRIFIGSHSLPPLWFAVSVLQPAALDVRAPRAALGPSARDAPSPCERAPPGPGAPLDGVRRHVCTVRAERATDCRSTGGIAAVRAATKDGYHGSIFTVTPPSPTNSIRPI
jgi:hypothetical protein